MEVETYEQISVDEQNGEVINELVSEESLALIESLGLTGQQTLIEKHQVGDEAVETRTPYRKMTLEENRVFSAIMPARTSIKSYSSDPIPLRVLQVAAHAETLFEDLIIWHPEDARDDPILVGMRAIPGQSWGKDVFILARWGEHLIPFEDLKLKARTIIKSNTEQKIAEAHESLDTFERCLEVNISAFLNGGKQAITYGTISLGN